MEKTLFTLFLGLFIFSAALNFLLLKWTRTLEGKNDVNSNESRWSDDYKPAIGGISFFIVFLIAFLVYFFLFNDHSLSLVSTEMGFIAAVVLGFFTGLVDDTFNMVPWLKFIAQMTCGVILVLADVNIDLFGVYALDAFLTIFWTIAVMNSINMLDNMDGITTIASIGILLSAGVCALPLDMTSIFFILICGGIIASLFGFLLFNWNPAKMFMGDTGSQLLGALLAGVGVVFFWNNENIILDHHWYSKAAIVLTAFVIPIADSITVTINRLKRGQSPFLGGRDHTTHHLSYAGLSDRQVALVYVAIAGLSMLLISMLNFLNDQFLIIYIAGLLTYSFLIITFLYSTTMWKKSKSKFETTQLSSQT